MKRILLLGMLAIASLSYSQWGYDKMINEDGPYPIAYTKDLEKGNYMKMEAVGGKIVLYIQDGFDAPDAYVSAIFVTPTGNYEVKFHGITKDDGNIMQLETNLADAYYLTYFKQASKVAFKLVFTDYEDMYYVFNMRYSASAFNFMYNNRWL